MTLLCPYCGNCDVPERFVELDDGSEQYLNVLYCETTDNDMPTSETAWLDRAVEISLELSKATDRKEQKWLLVLLAACSEAVS